MRIAIDAHVIGAKAGGNETYMRGLLAALYEHAPEEDIVALINPGESRNPEAQIGFRSLELPVRSSYLRVPFALPWMVKKSGADLLHVQYTAPPWSPKPYVVSMHDAVVRRYPDSLPKSDRYRLYLLSNNTLRRAARVFVLTRAMQEELAEFYKIPEARFDLVQPALDPHFRPVEDAGRLAAVREKYQLPSEFLLYVGLIQPRKNLVRLVRAFAQLRDRGLDIPLVIVGKKAWLFKEMLEEIAALGVDDRLFFTGYVDGADLPALYSSATAFTYLSLYEGFGIPVLEALACGAPALISTDPALVEVSGGQALAVDPEDIEGICEGMARVISDTAIRARLCAGGPERAHYFTTAHMAKHALAGYRKALA